MSDGEYMAGLLASEGYRITDTPTEADVWVLNSCTVKNPSQDVFVNEIASGHAENKKLVVAGCVPQGDPKNSSWNGLSIVGVQEIDRIVEVVEETLKGNTVVALAQKKVARESDPRRKRKAGGAALNLPKIRRNPLIEIIPINTGCLNQCTYCKTKHARGDLGSYPIQEIVDRVKQVVMEGVVEIWLTSEDTGTYGRDIDTDLPTLLWSVVAEIPEGVMLRLGMTNPPYILEHLEQVSKILNHPRVYSFLHVPVQAASDHVLEDMRRKYTLADFEQVFDYLNERVPGVTVATDVICGFPTETAEDFDRTLDLVNRKRFRVLHISQFYPRPGTPAARLPRVPTKEVKRRSRAITEMFNSYLPYGHRLGEQLKVLVTEYSKDGVHMVGHSKAYEQILIPIDDALLGKMVLVQVVETAKWHMVGKVLNILESTKYETKQTLQHPSQGRKGRRDDEDEIEEIENEDQSPEAPPLTQVHNGALLAQSRTLIVTVGVAALAVLVWFFLFRRVN
eukprot:c8143_g1_i1.p1 GENE.c8143_g1_i1~~c8143_g1_i1.p1  ORF type:complete len:593 (+),score=136.57 c8143_g1_i1:259-1779(+)